MTTATKKNDADTLARGIVEAFSDPNLIGAGGNDMSIVHAIYLISRGLFEIADQMKIQARIEEHRNAILGEISEQITNAYEFYSTGLRP
jgi:hypothetical protein